MWCYHFAAIVRFSMMIDVHFDRLAWEPPHCHDEFVRKICFFFVLLLLFGTKRMHFFRLLPISFSYSLIGYERPKNICGQGKKQCFLEYFASLWPINFLNTTNILRSCHSFSLFQEFAVRWTKLEIKKHKQKITTILIYLVDARP